MNEPADLSELRLPLVEAALSHLKSSGASTARVVDERDDGSLLSINVTLSEIEHPDAEKRLMTDIAPLGSELQHRD
jgi:hypothetical protein